MISLQTRMFKEKNSRREKKKINVFIKLYVNMYISLYFPALDRLLRAVVTAQLREFNKQLDSALRQNV